MTALSVSLDDYQVGWLEELDDLYYCFIFDPDWLEDPQKPILGQLFEDKAPNNIITGGTPCWFAHLLPQRALRKLVAASAGVNADDDFEVLKAAGEDLPGAVVLRETESQLTRRVVPAKHVRTPEPNYRIGFSLAGNQWKLSVREGTRGLVVPTQGENAEWIAKFHDPEHPRLPQVEYATTLLAQRCGILTPEVRLVSTGQFESLPDELPTGDGTVFLSRRFDRCGGRRIHMEDFAQILDRPPGEIYLGGYEEIGRLLWYLSPGDIGRFIEQLIFCIVVGNGDAHLKNWSLTYIGGREAQLSPAYDLVPTVVYIRKERLALSLGSIDAFDRLRSQSFQRMAHLVGWGEEEMYSRIEYLVGHFSSVCRDNLIDVGFDEREQKILKSHIEGILRQFC